jgi:hypothetical protein
MTAFNTGNNNMATRYKKSKKKIKDKPKKREIGSHPTLTQNHQSFQENDTKLSLSFTKSRRLLLLQFL